MLPALFAIGMGVLALGCGACSETHGSKPYNVVLITLDTTRADFFSCYGFPQPTTPNFDALAAEGVRFEMGVTTAAVTPVSHASILTGRFNHEHGLRVMSADSGFRLDEDVPALFPTLQQHGWTTIAVHSAFPVSGWFGFERGFDVFESFDGVMNTAGDRHQWDVRNAQRRSDETTDIALAALDGLQGPWALWVHYWDPHDTVRLPPDVEHPSYPPGTTMDAIIADMREIYARELSFVDQGFGRLVEALRARGEWERTIVVVVSDHGEGLADHGWGFHRVLYQEQMRAPYLMRLPGFENGTSGAVLDPLVRTIDIAPTILDYLALPPLEHASGRSLRALVEGREDEPRVAFADQINGYDRNAGERLLTERPQDTFVYCAMDRRWKLLYRPAAPEQSELFDLIADPDEAHDLYRRDHPEVLRLLRRLADEAPWVPAPFAGVAGGSGAQGAQAMLNGLGYTGSQIVSEDWQWTSVDDPSWTSDEYERDPNGALPILIGR